jgi:hypothetical protein
VAQLERTNGILRRLGRNSVGDLSPALQEMLAAGFVEANGSVVWAHLEEGAHSLPVGAAATMSEVESLINHIHLEDELPGPHTREFLVDQGLTFARGIAETLERDYPGRTFEVMFGYSDQALSREQEIATGTYDSNDRNWPSATVRFYSIGDDRWAWHRNVEGFLQDAVLIIEVA